jgi:ELWxxDGT repeat protein
MTDHRRIRSAAAGALILAAGLAHAQGTASMLSDICPGTAGSQASGFSDCGTALYFRARILPDLVSFRTFRTDGTPGGTVSISYPGLTFAGVPILYGGRHYFGGTEGTMGSELYSGDGTTATLVLDINPGAASSTPQDLVVVRGLLFFRAFVGTRWGLWRSDGTAAGTFPLADLGTMNVPMVAAPSRDFLYFVPEDATVGRELWRTDGTLAGTVLVADINPGVASSNPQRLTDDGLILFFGATTPSTGLEPWVTDGTNTTLLRDISPGPGSSLLFGTPSERMVAAGGNLVFAAFDLANGRELWKSDGTPGGTVLLKDLVPGEDPSQPSELTKFGDLVLISAMDLGLAIRLWKTDGTTAGTVQLTLASQGSGPFAVPGAGRAVFLGTANATGNELYRTDG